MSQEIIRVAGLTYRNESQFSEQIQAAIAQGAHEIILDMSAVTRMDSAGVGELLHGYSSAQKKAIPMVLAGTHSLVVETLRLMDLLQFLPLYDTLDQAKSAGAAS